MSTPLYSTDIIPMTSRPTLTVMDDGDYFVILDTSTGKISKILRTNIQKALNISYDNTTSELTAETVQAALDELVVNLGSSDDAILALSGRLDTLEGTGEGSVAKAIEDAVSPLEERIAQNESDIGTLEGVVDTNRLYSDSQYLELKAKADALQVKCNTLQAEVYTDAPILQYGATEIIGKGYESDDMPIDVSANVVDGSLDMEQKGLTITNLVDGADIADSGTVSFNTVNGDKYFDTLNETIITGDGTEMSATNSSGATANMAIYHLNAHGLQAITDTTILSKLLPYVDGTKNVGKMGMQILDADDNVTQTIFLPEVGNRVPNGTADSIKTVADGWEHTKRVGLGVLPTTGYDLLDTSLPSVYRFRLPFMNIKFPGILGLSVTDKTTYIVLDGVPLTYLANASSDTAHFYMDSYSLWLFLPKATIDAQTGATVLLKISAYLASVDNEFYYAITPITTHYDLPLPTSGKTIHRFAGEEKIALYGTGLTFSENVLTVLSAIKFVAGVMTDITSLATITTNTVTFSGVSATDVVYVKVEHDVDRPLGILEHTPAVSNTASRLASLEARVSALEG